VDYTGVDVAVLVALFAALFLCAAVAAGWILVNPTARSQPAYQVIAALGTIATLPALIVAPIEEGTVLNVLSWVAIAGLLVTAAAVILFMMRPQPATAPVAGLRPAAAGMPGPAPNAPAAVTRIGSPQAATSVSPQRPADVGGRTEVHGAGSRSVGRIAFLVEYSGDGTPHRLGEDTAIGRNTESTIVVDDNEASRDHARVKFENERFVLYDLGATNGTQLLRDGRHRRVTSPTLLNDQDVIVIGRTELAFMEVDS